MAELRRPRSISSTLLRELVTEQLRVHPDADRGSTSWTSAAGPGCWPPNWRREAIG